MAGVKLSVNLNKVATLRNARGGDNPSVLEAMRVVVDAGAPGITVHPRADERHIRRSDLVELSHALEPLRDRVEFNVEGDPRPDLMDRVVELRPHQCTLVPVRPGEITSEAGWARKDDSDEIDALRRAIDRLREPGIRVSLFVEADPQAVTWAKELGADRVELYTEPYARAFASGDEAALGAQIARYQAAAAHAYELGLGVNAGHDLDLANLPGFARAMPHLDEVSIGHALIARALYVGLDTVVREYLECVVDA